MAYGDFTLFNPAESAYQEPGQFEAAAKAGALQKASYMSEMDKFYAQLSETQRQFDITAELERGTQTLQGRGLDIQEAELTEQGREFDLSFGLAERTQTEAERAALVEEEQFSQTFGLESARLLEEGRQFDTGMGLAQAQLAISKGLSEAQIEQLGAVTGLTAAQTKSTGLGDTLGILGLALGGTNVLFGEKNLDIDLKDITDVGSSAIDALSKLTSAGTEYETVLDIPYIDWEGIGTLTGTDWSEYGDVEWPWEADDYEGMFN